jgi:hypothetical protein
MFDKYLAKNFKLSAIDQDMINLALQYGISNTKPIDYYGINGLVKPSFNGLYTGAYQYGDNDNFVGICFSVRIDRDHVDDSDIMITRGIIVKDNEIVVKQDWKQIKK